MLRGHIFSLLARVENVRLRILHTADWHLGRALGGHSLLPDQAYILHQLVDIARQAAPDLVLIAGDLYDRSLPPAEAVTLLDEILGELVLGLELPVVAIAGNHDSAERLNFGARLMANQRLHMVGTVDTAGWVSVPNRAGTEAVSVLALPYAEPASIRAVWPQAEVPDHDAALAHLLRHWQAAETAPAGRSEPAVVMAHAFVAGGLGCESERPLSVGTAGQVRPGLLAPFAYAALGHLHRPQTAGAPHLRYSGSPLKYSIDEADHAKSLALVNLSPGQPPQIELVPHRPKRDLRLLRGTFDELHQGPLDEDFVQITLTDRGLIPDAVGRLRHRFPNLIGLERAALSETTENAPLLGRKSATPVELFSAFYQELTGQPASPEELSVIERAQQRLAKEEAGLA